MLCSTLSSFQCESFVLFLFLRCIFLSRDFRSPRILAEDPESSTNGFYPLIRSSAELLEGILCVPSPRCNPQPPSEQRSSTRLSVGDEEQGKRHHAALAAAFLPHFYLAPKAAPAARGAALRCGSLQQQDVEFSLWKHREFAGRRSSASPVRQISAPR